MDIHAVLYWVGALLAFGMGMGCGSYATMPYYRLPNGIVSAGRWVGKRSACPSCDTQLRTRDMVPIFNQLFNRGQCFACGTKVSRVYFAIELTCAISALLLYFRYGFSEVFLTSYGVAVCMVILAATDYTYRKIPKEVLVVAIIFGALAMEPSVMLDRIQLFFVGIFACVFFASVYEKLYRRPYAKYDYLKLLCLGAIWMNPWVFLASILGALLVMLSTEPLSVRQERGLAYGLYFAVVMLLERVLL